jgi:membrane protease YdiL (CAAX protease family)
MRDTPKRATYLYLQLTLAFSAVVWILIIWSGHLNMGFGLVVPAIMWCPGLAALVTCNLLGRGLRSLAWQWPSSRYIGAAYFVPLAYISVAYGAVWGCRLGGWNYEFVSLVAQSFGLRGLPVWGSFTLYIAFMATGGVLLNVSTTLGEEIGWRGFLVPELAKQMSFTRLSLVSGLVWAGWHAPLLLFADYNAGTNRWYELGCSTVTLVSASFILAWLRLKSGSLWPAALFHASYNLFVPGVFDNLIRNTGSTLWYTTQFGAALAIASVVFALYFWTQRAEIPDQLRFRFGVQADAPAVTAGTQQIL